MKETKCPICGFQSSIRNYGGKVEWQKKEIRHHITVKAKNELWAKEWSKNIETPHLDYVRKNKTVKRVEISYKVNF